jgi:hypothetical protein
MISLVVDGRLSPVGALRPLLGSRRRAQEARPGRKKRGAGTRKIALFDKGESGMGGFWRNEPTLQERNRRASGTIEATAGFVRGVSHPDVREKPLM